MTEAINIDAVSVREEELSNKLAELTKEVNQFTYIVSHDLQAPLRTVTGFLELLEKRHGDKLDASAKQYIDHAVKGVAKMKSLVFDLLEYSRLNNADAAFTEVDMNLIVKEVKEKMSSIISDTGAVINVSNLPKLMANKKQMEQLVGHLLQNALKFQNGKTPEITVISKEDDNNCVIGIKDNGIGIDAAFFEKIFTMFRRLHSDETKYKGTGAGLAICKKIVDLHNGVIWVESGLNEGSTFWFRLPYNWSN
jgi:light-regulated signal transduction histidine kinase (bacteriophytochrome)